MSFKAGTIFQDSHLPVAIWFRAMWHITSQRNGIGASDLQRVLGLGSYKTAWTVLQKLRRVMVLPRRGLLEGVVEVDLTSWGQDDVETGAIGWQTRPEGLIAVAAQEEGKGVGRICVLRIRDRTTASLHKFVAQTIAPGSTVRTNGQAGWLGLKGFDHRGQQEHGLPRVRGVISLLQRYLRFKIAGRD